MLKLRSRVAPAALSIGMVTLAAAGLGGCAGEVDDDLEPGAAGGGTEVALAGQLQVVMVGNGEVSHPEYFLEVANRGDVWLRLSFARRPDLIADHSHNGIDNHQHLLGGTVVRVKGGYLDGDSFEVADLVITGASPSTDAIGQVQGALISPSPKKVAVILANFSNDPAQPITADEARNRVFTSTTSANAYFKEQSFGVRSLTGVQRADGDVFGWYTITATNSPCDYSAWGNAARAAAQAAGVSLTGYDQIIHYFSRAPSCSWSGVGQLPGRYSWINASSSSTIAHELGHNFGVHHASSLTCTSASGGRVPVSATCTSSEYGDPFDVMGRGYRHMNIYQKGRLGFLETANTTTVAASGTFTVAPIAQKATGTQALRVPIPGTSQPQLYYYVEFRQPFGFDSFTPTSSVVNGVLIHRAPAYTTLQRTQLLDLVPATTSFNDAALVVGTTFTDPTAPTITIRVTAVAPTGATVAVTM
jgi:hypothetical protein